METFIKKLQELSYEHHQNTRLLSGGIGKYINQVYVIDESHFFQKDSILCVNVHPFERPFSITTPVVPHQHDFYELSFVYQGSAVNTIITENGSVSINMAENDICLMNPNARHDFSIRSKNDIVLNILIKKQFFEQGFSEIPADSNPLRDFFVDAMFCQKNAQHYLLFTHQDCPHLKNSVLDLAKKYTDNQLNSYLREKGQLFLLIADMFEAYRNIMDPPNTFHDQKISDILTYILDNSASVTLNKTAGYFHYNPQYLSRKLKAQTKKNFSELVHDIRLKKSADLLLNTTMTIQEIADETGFQISYLYHIFKKSYGCSPTEYRQNKHRDNTACRQ